MNDFSKFTPEAGRQIVKQSGVLILPEWDIVNALVFDSIRKQKDVKLETEEKILQAHRGVKFSNDHQALVIWSIEKRDETIMQEISTAEHTGAMTVFRAGEIGSSKIWGMASEMVEFGKVVSSQENDRFSQLNARFEEVLKAYEERGVKIQLLENQISQIEKVQGKRKIGESSVSRITHIPHVSTRSTPIIEIPDTLERPQFYTADDFEEEKTKMHELQEDLKNQYKEKLKQGIMYLRNKIGWSTFFD